MKLCRNAAAEGRDWWVSDDPADRERAKRICDRCTESPACLRGALERGEKHHVWGGIDLGVVDMAEPDWLPQVFTPAHNRSHYMSGCREPECLAANAAYVAAWRQERAWHPVERETPPEQLDLFAPVTASDWVEA